MLYILKWYLEIGSHKQITRSKLACRTYLASRVPKGLRVRAWVCVKVRYIYNTLYVQRVNLSKQNVDVMLTSHQCHINVCKSILDVNMS